MEQLLLLFQVLQIGAAMLLAGGALMFPVLHGATTGGRWRQGVRWLLAIVVVAAGFGWLGTLTALMAGDPAAMLDRNTLFGVLTGTQFGRIWVWREAGAILLPPLLFACSGKFRRQAENGVALLSLAILFSLALTGHAVSQSGAPGVTHEINHAIHLLCGAIWLGGLWALLARIATRDADSARPADLATTLHRFSVIGYAAVAVIATTGLINTALIAGHSIGSPQGPWWRALGIKLTLVGGMLGLAVVNRYLLTPRLLSPSSRLRGWLGLSVSVELILGISVIAAAAWLGSLPPPGGG